MVVARHGAIVSARAPPCGRLLQNDESEASPLHRGHAEAPPFPILYGARDSLASVEQARDFVARLQQESKSPVGYAELPGAQHAFEVFHSLRSRQAVASVADFLEGLHAHYRSGRTP